MRLEHFHATNPCGPRGRNSCNLRPTGRFPPAANAVACGSGGWNFYTDTTGACAWGDMYDWSSAPLDQTAIDFRLKDTKADGECARIEVWEKITAGRDDHFTLSKKACGKGEDVRVEARFGWIGGSRYVRVCSVSCGSWEHIYAK